MDVFHWSKQELPVQAPSSLLLSVPTSRSVFKFTWHTVSKVNTDNGAPVFTGVIPKWLVPFWCHSRSTPGKPVLSCSEVQGGSVFSSHWVRSHSVYDHARISFQVIPIVWPLGCIAISEKQNRTRRQVMQAAAIPSLAAIAHFTSQSGGIVYGEWSKGSEIGIMIFLLLTCACMLDAKSYGFVWQGSGSGGLWGGFCAKLLEASHMSDKASARRL